MNHQSDHRSILAALAGNGCWQEARDFCRLLAITVDYDYASGLWREFYGRGLCDED